MDFFTINQYFNKLQIALFLLLMGPLLAFLALYFFTSALPSDQRSGYFVIIPAAVLDWFLAITIFNKKIKSARNQQGLSAKLHKYFKITIIRYSLLALGSFGLAIGAYFTGSDIFAALYVGGLILSGILWPSSKKVARDLKLKGDEREMVYFKRDSF